MAQIDTAQAGVWSDTDTWVGGVLPVLGDSVVLFHAVTLDINVSIGTGLTDRPYITFEDPTGFSLFIAAPFEIAEDITLSMDGDVYSTDDTVMRLGSAVSWIGTGLHRWEQYDGFSNKHLKIEGTVAKPCSISATVGEWWMPVFASTAYFVGDARVVATWCDVSQHGDATHTTGMYIHVAGFGASDPYSLTDCNFTDGYQVGFPFLEDTHVGATGTVVVARCHFHDTLVPGGEGAEYSQLRMWSLPTMTYTIDKNRFDRRFAIIHPDDATITNNVFEQGIWWTNDATSDFFAGASLETFEDNYIQATTGSGNLNIRYGDTITRCLFIDQDNTKDNPNFCATRGGAGDVLLDQCVVWSAFDGVATAAGDWINVSYAASGDTTSNVVTANECIILPNGNGYGDANSISGTLFTFSQSGDIQASVVATRCTVVAANGNAFAIGETNATLIDTIGDCTSNLIVGSGSGHKMFDLSPGADEDAVINADVHHNGGYLLAQGAAQAAFPTSGKGYSIFPESSVTVIGLNDVDDEDPNFVAPSRTPLTWDISLGGTGTFAEVLDRLGPGGASDVIDLHAYIRAGFVPQNTAYQGTGSGGVDIGAMNVVPISSGRPSRMLL